MMYKYKKGQKVIYTGDNMFRNLVGIIREEIETGLYKVELPSGDIVTWNSKNFHLYITH